MRSQTSVETSDVVTQVRDWQSCSSDGLTEEIARRPSTYRFAFTTAAPVPLKRNYHRRVEYKQLGATYNGNTQQWSMPAGSDLRRLLDAHYEWIDEPDMVKRRILSRIITELESEPLLH